MENIEPVDNKLLPEGTEDDMIITNKIELRKFIRDSVEDVLIQNETLEPNFDFHQLFDEPLEDQGILAKMMPYAGIVLNLIVLVLLIMK